MKYRILEKKYADSTSDFIPQRKRFVFWRSLKDKDRDVVKLNNYDSAMESIEQDITRRNRCTLVRRIAHPVSVPRT